MAVSAMEKAFIVSNIDLWLESDEAERFCIMPETDPKVSHAAET